MTRRRPLALGLLLPLAALALVLGSAAPASAASYRYWTYWHGTSSGGWTFSPVGATYRPADKSVDGWRFAVSGTAASTQPRMSASFSVICSGRTATAGNKLVALVVDYGTSTEAPPGEQPPYVQPRTYCADVAQTANAYAILQLYSPGAGGVRSAGGLICGIHGYPAQECGVVVAPLPSPSPKPTSHPSTLPHPTTGAGGTSASTRSSSTTSGQASATATGTSAPASPTSGSAVPSPSGTGQGGASGGAQTTFPVAQAMGSEASIDGGSGGGVPWPSLAGGALVLLLGGAAVVRSRRSPTAGGR